MKTEDDEKPASLKEDPVSFFRNKVLDFVDHPRNIDTSPEGPHTVHSSPDER